MVGVISLVGLVGAWSGVVTVVATAGGVGSEAILLLVGLVAARRALRLARCICRISFMRLCGPVVWLVVLVLVDVLSGVEAVVVVGVVGVTEVVSELVELAARRLRRRAWYSCRISFVCLWGFAGSGGGVGVVVVGLVLVVVGVVVVVFFTGVVVGVVVVVVVGVLVLVEVVAMVVLEGGELAGVSVASSLIPVVSALTSAVVIDMGLVRRGVNAGAFADNVSLGLVRVIGEVEGLGVEGGGLPRVWLG